jgi:hypothetical protein
MQALLNIPVVFIRNLVHTVLATGAGCAGGEQHAGEIYEVYSITMRPYISPVSTLESEAAA